MNIISCSQFETAKDVKRIFDAADKITDPYPRFDPFYVGRGKIMASLFYEPSTRTRFSFETAMLKLGGGVISTEDATQFSSHMKGETLEDTLAVVSRYADVIVIRHGSGSLDYLNAAVAESRVPVINAGNGSGEHPTQALLDVYTMEKKLKTINGKNIVLVGDLKHSRTIHSLVYLLTLYKPEAIHLVSPKDLGLPEKYRELCKERDVDYYGWRSIKECLYYTSADVIYMTRLQTERFASEGNTIHEDYISDCYLGPEEFDRSGDAIIMHPLPRRDEISSYVDDSPRAVYLREQIDSGLAIRMGILYSIFGEPYV